MSETAAPESEAPDSFPITNRNRLRRKHQRGRHDRKSVYEILDAAMLCHIAYNIDGQPYCTPTAFWREGDHLYWHASSASRMIRAQAAGIPVCVTVTHLDGIVLARCGFNHSVNYRSVMAFGNAYVVEGEEKLAAIDAFIDRFYPGRSKILRASTAQEVKATTFLGMHMDEASAKIRSMGVADDEEDYAVPCWTAEWTVKQVLGPITECPRQLPGVTRPPEMDGYVEGRPLDEIFSDAMKRLYPED